MYVPDEADETLAVVGQRRFLLCLRAFRMAEGGRWRWQYEVNIIKQMAIGLAPPMNFKSLLDGRGSAASLD